MLTSYVKDGHSEPADRLHGRRCQTLSKVSSSEFDRQRPGGPVGRRGLTDLLPHLDAASLKQLNAFRDRTWH